jgi:hypothetical protein
MISRQQCPPAARRGLIENRVHPRPVRCLATKGPQGLLHHKEIGHTPFRDRPGRLYSASGRCDDGTAEGYPGYPNGTQPGLITVPLEQTLKQGVFHFVVACQATAGFVPRPSLHSDALIWSADPDGVTAGVEHAHHAVETIRQPFVSKLPRVVSLPLNGR